MSSAIKKSLEKLPVEELTELQTYIATLIGIRQNEIRKSLKKQFKQLAQQSGLSLEQVIGVATPATSERKKKHYKAKYFNPGKPEQTWVGVGVKPRWFREALERGVTADEMLVR